MGPTWAGAFWQIKLAFLELEGLWYYGIKRVLGPWFLSWGFMVQCCGIFLEELAALLTHTACKWWCKSKKNMLTKKNTDVSKEKAPILQKELLDLWPQIFCWKSGPYYVLGSLQLSTNATMPTSLCWYRYSNGNCYGNGACSFLSGRLGWCIYWFVKKRLKFCSYRIFLVIHVLCSCP